jgi:hypothetical protein
LRSLQVESKTKIWHPVKIIHLLRLINRGGFQALSKKKSKAKVGGKSALFLVFFLSSQALSHRFLLFHYQAFIVIATSSHTSDFLAPPGMSSASLLLWSGKPSSSFTLPPGGYCMQWPKNSHGCWVRPVTMWIMGWTRSNLA